MLTTGVLSMKLNKPNITVGMVQAVLEMRRMKMMKTRLMMQMVITTRWHLKMMFQVLKICSKVTARHYVFKESVDVSDLVDARLTMIDVEG